MGNCTTCKWNETLVKQAFCLQGHARVLTSMFNDVTPIENCHAYQVKENCECWKWTRWCQVYGGREWSKMNMFDMICKKCGRKL